MPVVKLEISEAQKTPRSTKSPSYSTLCVQSITCANGHALKQYRTPYDHYTCSRCERHFKWRTVLYGCRECDYDTCQKCIKHPGWKRVKGSGVANTTRSKDQPLPCVGGARGEGGEKRRDSFPPYSVESLAGPPQDARRVSLPTRSSANSSTPPKLDRRLGTSLDFEGAPEQEDRPMSQLPPPSPPSPTTLSPVPEGLRKRRLSADFDDDDRVLEAAEDAELEQRARQHAKQQEVEAAEARASRAVEREEAEAQAAAEKKEAAALRQEEKRRQVRERNQTKRKEKQEQKQEQKQKQSQKQEQKKQQQKREEERRALVALRGESKHGDEEEEGRDGRREEVLRRERVASAAVRAAGKVRVRHERRLGHLERALSEKQAPPRSTGGRGGGGSGDGGGGGGGGIGSGKAAVSGGGATADDTKPEKEGLKSSSPRGQIRDEMRQRKEAAAAAMLEKQLIKTPATTTVDAAVDAAAGSNAEDENAAEGGNKHKGEVDDTNDDPACVVAEPAKETPIEPRGAKVTSEQLDEVLLGQLGSAALEALEAKAETPEHLDQIRSSMDIAKVREEEEEHKESEAIPAATSTLTTTRATTSTSTTSSPDKKTPLKRQQSRKSGVDRTAVMAAGKEEVDTKATAAAATAMEAEDSSSSGSSSSSDGGDDGARSAHVSSSSGRQQQPTETLLLQVEKETRRAALARVRGRVASDAWTDALAEQQILSLEVDQAHRSRLEQKVSSSSSSSSSPPSGQGNEADATPPKARQTRHKNRPNSEKEVDSGRTLLGADERLERRRLNQARAALAKAQEAEAACFLARMQAEAEGTWRLVRETSARRRLEQADFQRPPRQPEPAPSAPLHTRIRVGEEEEEEGSEGGGEGKPENPSGGEKKKAPSDLLSLLPQLSSLALFQLLADDDDHDDDDHDSDSSHHRKLSGSERKAVERCKAFAVREEEEVAGAGLKREQEGLKAKGAVEEARSVLKARLAAVARARRVRGKEEAQARHEQGRESEKLQTDAAAASDRTAQDADLKAREKAALTEARVKADASALAEVTAVVKRCQDEVKACAAREEACAVKAFKEEEGEEDAAAAASVGSKNASLRFEDTKRKRAVLEAKAASSAAALQLGAALKAERDFVTQRRRQAKRDARRDTTEELEARRFKARAERQGAPMSRRKGGGRVGAARMRVAEMEAGEAKAKKERAQARAKAEALTREEERHKAQAKVDADLQAGLPVESDSLELAGVDFLTALLDEDRVTSSADRENVLNARAKAVRSEEERQRFHETQTRALERSERVHEKRRARSEERRTEADLERKEQRRVAAEQKKATEAVGSERARRQSERKAFRSRLRDDAALSELERQQMERGVAEARVAASSEAKRAKANDRAALGERRQNERSASTAVRSGLKEGSGQSLLDQVDLLGMLGSRELRRLTREAGSTTAASNKLSREERDLLLAYTEKAQRREASHEQRAVEQRKEGKQARADTKENARLARQKQRAGAGRRSELAWQERKAANAKGLDEKVKLKQNAADFALSRKERAKRPAFKKDQERVLAARAFEDLRFEALVEERRLRSKDAEAQVLSALERGREVDRAVVAVLGVNELQNLMARQGPLLSSQDHEVLLAQEERAKKQQTEEDSVELQKQRDRANVDSEVASERALFEAKQSHVQSVKARKEADAQAKRKETALKAKQRAERGLAEKRAVAVGREAESRARSTALEEERKQRVDAVAKQKRAASEKEQHHRKITTESQDRFVRGAKRAREKKDANAKSQIYSDLRDGKPLNVSLLSSVKSGTLGRLSTHKKLSPEEKAAVLEEQARARAAEEEQSERDLKEIALNEDRVRCSCEESRAETQEGRVADRKLDQDGALRARTERRYALDDARDAGKVASARMKTRSAEAVLNAAKTSEEVASAQVAVDRSKALEAQLAKELVQKEVIRKRQRALREEERANCEASDAVIAKAKRDVVKNNNEDATAARQRLREAKAEEKATKKQRAAETANKREKEREAVKEITADMKDDKPLNTDLLPNLGCRQLSLLLTSKQLSEEEKSEVKGELKRAEQNKEKSKQHKLLGRIALKEHAKAGKGESRNQRQLFMSEKRLQIDDAKKSKKASTSSTQVKVRKIKAGSRRKEAKFKAHLQGTALIDVLMKLFRKREAESEEVRQAKAEAWLKRNADNAHAREQKRNAQTQNRIKRVADKRMDAVARKDGRIAEQRSTEDAKLEAVSVRRAEQEKTCMAEIEADLKDGKGLNKKLLPILGTESLDALLDGGMLSESETSATKKAKAKAAHTEEQEYTTSEKRQANREKADARNVAMRTSIEERAANQEAARAEREGQRTLSLQQREARAAERAAKKAEAKVQNSGDDKVRANATRTDFVRADAQFCLDVKPAETKQREATNEENKVRIRREKTSTLTESRAKKVIANAAIARTKRDLTVKKANEAAATKAYKQKLKSETNRTKKQRAAETANKREKEREAVKQIAADMKEDKPLNTDLISSLSSKELSLLLTSQNISDEEKVIARKVMEQVSIDEETEKKREFSERMAVKERTKKDRDDAKLRQHLMETEAKSQVMDAKQLKKASTALKKARLDEAACESSDQARQARVDAWLERNASNAKVKEQKRHELEQARIQRVAEKRVEGTARYEKRIAEQRSTEDAKLEAVSVRRAEQEKTSMAEIEADLKDGKGLNKKLLPILGTESLDALLDGGMLSESETSATKKAKARAAHTEEQEYTTSEKRQANREKADARNVAMRTSIEERAANQEAARAEREGQRTLSLQQREARAAERAAKKEEAAVQNSIEVKARVDAARASLEGRETCATREPSKEKKALLQTTTAKAKESRAQENRGRDLNTVKEVNAKTQIDCDLKQGNRPDANLLKELGSSRLVEVSRSDHLSEEDRALVEQELKRAREEEALQQGEKHRKMRKNSAEEKKRQERLLLKQARAKKLEELKAIEKAKAHVLNLETTARRRAADEAMAKAKRDLTVAKAEEIGAARKRREEMQVKEKEEHFLHTLDKTNKREKKHEAVKQITANMKEDKPLNTDLLPFLGSKELSLLLSSKEVSEEEKVEVEKELKRTMKGDKEAEERDKKALGIVRKDAKAERAKALERRRAAEAEAVVAKSSALQEKRAAGKHQNLARKESAENRRNTTKAADAALRALAAKEKKAMRARKKAEADEGHAKREVERATAADVKAKSLQAEVEALKAEIARDLDMVPLRQSHDREEGGNTNEGDNDDNDAASNSTARAMSSSQNSEGSGAELAKGSPKYSNGDKSGTPRTDTTSLLNNTNTAEDKPQETGKSKMTEKKKKPPSRFGLRTSNKVGKVTKGATAGVDMSK